MFEKTMDTKPISQFDQGPGARADSSSPGFTETRAADAMMTPAAPESASDQASSPLPATSPAVPVVGKREFPLWDVFVGPNGLYPGTRWVIYLALALLVYVVEEWLTQQYRAPNAGSLAASMTWELSVLFAAILPAFVMARLERRSIADFGLPGQQAFGRNFWVGVLWGLTSLSALMLVLRLAGAFEFGSIALRGSDILKFASYYLLLFLATGFVEEFLFRGYSQWVLSQGMNFWPAAALLSCGFGAIHSANAGEAKSGLVAAGLIGFFFCLTLRRTGSLWWAIGFHMSWDWGESYLYSVPDSGGMLPGHLLNSSFHGPTWLTGGTVGPEGSLLIFVLLVILWVVFDRVYPQVKYEAK